MGYLKIKAIILWKKRKNSKNTQELQFIAQSLYSENNFIEL